MGDTLVRMPRLADTLVEGTLGHWLKQVGDDVGRGEPLASIETDKVTTEISSPKAGRLLEVLVGEGQTVAVDTPIARIGVPAADTPAEADNARAAGKAPEAEKAPEADNNPPAADS